MIRSPLLEYTEGFIAGQWTASADGERMVVRDPATGEELATVPRMGRAETLAAIEAGERALDPLPAAAERSQWLRRTAGLLLEHQEELGRIVTLEHGKPLAEGIAEVAYTAGFFKYFADILAEVRDELLPGRIKNCTWRVCHRPAGVAASITPWNFPLAMMGKKVAPALAAGCSLVQKPAAITPLSAIALWTLMHRAGVPAGRANLVIGSAGPIGEVLCTHPAVRVISFTGSTEVGRLLIAQSAPQVKRLSLELGGNAPFIVFPDADLPRAADELIANKFRSGGQTCVCTNRVYAHASVLEPLTALVVERAGQLKVGHGLDPSTRIGPLINREAWDKVAEHVGDALAGGARRWLGGDPPRPREAWGAFYPPTVLTGVTHQMRVCREETFGPVVAIAGFEDELEVVEAANETSYGLAAYVFTADRTRSERIAAALRFGHVGVNTGTGPTPEAPFGGMKQSGIGREGGLEGLMEYFETQTIVSGD